MTIRHLAISLFTVLLCASSGLAQDYQLGWQQIDSQIERAAPSQRLESRRDKVLSEALVKSQTLTSLRQAAYQPQPQTQPSYNIEILASEFFNHYEDKYRKVELVAVTTVRQGHTNHESYENVADYRTYDVYLTNLGLGDSYSVTVVWDDGSNRTVEKTIGEYAESSVLIDEPDYFAYSLW